MIKLRSTRISDGESPGRRIIRGELEPESLMALEFDWYQRGRLSPGKLNRLMRGVREGSEFPDITVGMRGHDFAEIGNSTALELFDPCYVIDGMQRVSAFIMVMEDSPEIPIRLGVKAFLDSDVDFENRLFTKMNTGHTSVSACVILRNEKEHSRLAGTLYGLTVTDRDFALHNRICWQQVVDGSVGGHLMRGNVLLKILATLHAHIMRGPGILNKVLDLLTSCERKIDLVGLHQSRLNLIAFFDAIDEAWGIRQAPIKFGTVYLQDGWTQVVAKIFNNHREFWHGKELFISRDAVRDLRKINPNDAELVGLARGNRTQHLMLYQLMLNIMNKGQTAANRYVDRDTLSKAEATRESERYGDGDGHHVGI